MTSGAQGTGTTGVGMTGASGVDAAHKVAHGHEREAPLWGVSAEFDDAAGLVDAIVALRGQDLGRLDAYSPVPLPDAADALDVTIPPMYTIAIVGAVLGASAMMSMCLYATMYDYVFNIGGRPLNSWPAYVVPSASFATLCGAFAVYLALLVLNRLPTLNHPAFNIPDFTRSTQDRYFLVVEARDERFDAALAERALGELRTRPRAVARVKR